MDNKKAKMILEGVLFSMGESVEIGRLADVIEMDKRATRKILEEMSEDYKSDERGIMLTWFENAVQLCTKPEIYDSLIKIAKNPPRFQLTDTVLETLSIIAYKQPVTRIEIEKVRGVSCDHAINKLLEYDLIQELGRLDAPGKPLLFGDQPCSDRRIQKTGGRGNSAKARHLVYNLDYFPKFKQFIS